MNEKKSLPESIKTLILSFMCYVKCHNTLASAIVAIFHCFISCLDCWKSRK